jgi:hypothetical protein
VRYSFFDDPVHRASASGSPWVRSTLNDAKAEDDLARRDALLDELRALAQAFPDDGPSTYSVPKNHRQQSARQPGDIMADCRATSSRKSLNNYGKVLKTESRPLVVGTGT